MSFFGKLVKTAVNVAVLPVKVAMDVALIPNDAFEGETPFKRTADQLQTIKDEADE